MTEELPDLVRTLSSDALMAYGGATWDWHKSHYDWEAARERGFEGPIVDGQMLGALLAIHATRPFGPSARLRSLSFRHRRVVVCNQTVTISGWIKGREELGSVLRLTLDQQGTVDAEVVLAPATAVVEIPADHAMVNP